MVFSFGKQTNELCSRCILHLHHISFIFLLLSVKRKLLCEIREIHQRRPTLICWMRWRPSSFIAFCLFSSRLTLGFGWGFTPGRGGSLAMDGVCWSDCGRETPEESFPDRLHISHTTAGLVFTKVQNWHIH